MTALVKRVGRWSAAVVLIPLGLLLALPGVPGPGILILLLGVLALLPESRWLRKKYARLKRRYPRLFMLVEHWRRRSRRGRRQARVRGAPRAGSLSHLKR